MKHFVSEDNRHSPTRKSLSITCRNRTGYWEPTDFSLTWQNKRWKSFANTVEPAGFNSLSLFSFRSDPNSVLFRVRKPNRHCTTTKYSNRVYLSWRMGNRWGKRAGSSILDTHVKKKYTFRLILNRECFLIFSHRDGTL